ncbi:MAG: ADP-ribosylation/Crystallin [Chthonomonadaceae bacterium]|nr:ADP-ribosylation/Crystallin [Chthonomonadaceae bacterium]
MTFSLPISKYTGCLLAAAIGDALATPFTGLTVEEIEATGRIGEFLPAREARSFIIPIGELGEAEVGDRLTAGQWTEDMQLTLALAEALIEENGAFIPEAWAHSLVRWINGEPRSPGISTLQTAIQLRTSGVMWDEAADPEGAGCGAAARVAPVALLLPEDDEKRRLIAITQAQVTHEHPDAQAAAMAIAEAIALLLPLDATALAAWDGSAFLAELVACVERASPRFAEFARCLVLARTLLEDKVEFATAVRVLGTSGWSREAVPCALFCVAHSPHDFEALLIQAVGQTSGSTEAIACMVGALAGAMHGLDAVPMRWRAGVEAAHSILTTARALHALAAA